MYYNSLLTYDYQIWCGDNGPLWGWQEMSTHWNGSCASCLWSYLTALFICIVYVPLMKKQFVKTHTICQTEIPGLLDSWLTNTPSVKMLSTRKLLVLMFSKSVTCLKVSVCWRLAKFFSVSCKTVSVGYGKLLFHGRYSYRGLRMSTIAKNYAFCIGK
jgi:hypothetical protein